VCVHTNKERAVHDASIDKTARLDPLKSHSIISKPYAKPRIPHAANSHGLDVIYVDAYEGPNGPKRNMKGQVGYVQQQQQEERRHLSENTTNPDDPVHEKLCQRIVLLKGARDAFPVASRPSKARKYAFA